MDIAIQYNSRMLSLSLFLSGSLLFLLLLLSLSILYYRHIKYRYLLYMLFMLKNIFTDCHSLIDSQFKKKSNNYIKLILKLKTFWVHWYLISDYVRSLFWASNTLQDHSKLILDTETGVSYFKQPSNRLYIASNSHSMDILMCLLIGDYKNTN